MSIPEHSRTIDGDALHAWLAEAALPPATMARLLVPSDYRRQRLERVRTRLDRLCTTPEERSAWWNMPIRVLGSVTPRGELSRGRIGPLFVAIRQAELASRRTRAETVTSLGRRRAS